MSEIYATCNEAGGMTAYNWREDPKRLAFQYSRYKFVAKMLEGKSRVLEVGCADGQGARIVRQHVGALDAVDIDEKAIATARVLRSERWPITFSVADIMDAPIYADYDAVYCLDVFEHIEDEGRLLQHLRGSADVCIVGAPSLESQRYASEISKAGHVNCLSGNDFRQHLGRHFSQVFLFGMNDEVVHTGFLPMAQYLLAVCVR